MVTLLETDAQGCTTALVFSSRILFFSIEMAGSLTSYSVRSCQSLNTEVRPVGMISFVRLERCVSSGATCTSSERFSRAFSETSV